MAGKRVRRPTKLSDAGPYPDPGMFIDARAQHSIDQAFIAVKALFEEKQETDSFKCRISDAELKSALSNIISSYWADCDYDARYTFADMRYEIKQIQAMARRFRSTIDRLPGPFIVALNEKMSYAPGKWLEFTDHIDEIKNSMIKLDGACAPFIKKTEDEKPRRSMCVDNACSALWDLWERISDKLFSRGWDIVKTPDNFIATRGKNEFKTLDSLFVQVSLCFLNPKIKAESIRVKLKRVAESKPKSA